MSRLVLSYDSAFLAMLLTDVSGEFAPCEKHICPIRPLGAKKVMVKTENPMLDYASDVCVVLAEFKLKDDAQDGKKLRKAAKLPLLGAFKKAKRNAPELYAAVRDGIEKLNAVERAREASLDLAANAFGEIMRDILRLAPLQKGTDDWERTRMVLAELGYWLGRAIYFLDAWDDREEDEKRGLYNPFLITKATKSDADFEINYSINSAISAYNLLDRGGKPDRTIEDNVFYLGLFSIWDGVAKGTNKRNKTKNTVMNIESFNEALEKQGEERTESDR